MAWFSPNAPGSNPYARERQQMVESQLVKRGIRSRAVLDAMLKIPRHEFVPPEHRAQAYGDHPIPLAEGQTISQPFIVARSLQALALSGSESVFEVGTGSGYQTALLAQLAREVYSIERYPTLAESAKTILGHLGLNNVKVIVGDGSNGLAEFAPYGAILVSAAAPAIPQSLLDQLSDNGRMVLPVGPREAQELQLVRTLDGKVTVEVLEGCCFVPLIGAGGY